MAFKQRIIAIAVSFMVAAGGLAFATVSGEAFTCPDPLSTHGQKDAYLNTGNYYEHHWLGWCDGNGWEYYAGNDSRYSSGGSWHPISHISAGLRAWDINGKLAYSNGVTLYNSAFNQLQTQDGIWDAQPECDSNDEAYQPGAFDWWNYLNYQGYAAIPASAPGSTTVSKVSGLSITEGPSSQQPTKLTNTLAAANAKSRLLKFGTHISGLTTSFMLHSSGLRAATDDSGRLVLTFSSAVNAWVIEFTAPAQDNWAVVRGLVIVNATSGLVESASLAAWS